VSQLYQRACVAIVDDTRIEGVRAVFKVVKTHKKEPNTLDLKLTNLAEKTRGLMKTKGAQVILTAGYVGQASVIFEGQARTIDHVRTGSDWVTHIQCGDGERAFQLSRFTQSFKPGTPVVDVVRAGARALGVGLGNLEEALARGGFRGNLSQFASGYSAKGRASSELDRLFRTLGLGWSIQDGNLVILKDGETLQDRAILLSPDTGLIGSPDHGAPNKKGGPSELKAKCLLQPQLKLGGRVELRTESIQGAQYRVDKLEHEGDSAGGNWYSSLELLPV
jgi:hypothetical protein